MSTMTSTRGKPAATTQVVVIDEKPTLDAVIAETCARMDRVAKNYKGEIEKTQDALRRAMLTADGIAKLRQCIEPLRDRIMGLMNTKLGFMTDRLPGNRRNLPAYDWSVVRECVIEALLKGFFPVGNEMNIISGGFYGTVNGYKRLCQEIPGMKGLELVPGVPRWEGERCTIRMAARWELDGHRMELKDGEGKAGRAYLIPTSDGAGPDNVIGKASRRTYKAIYEWLTGTDLGDVDDTAEVKVAPELASKTEELAAKLAGNVNGIRPEQPGPSDEQYQQQAPAEPQREPGVDEE